MSSARPPFPTSFYPLLPPPLAPQSPPSFLSPSGSGVPSRLRLPVNGRLRKGVPPLPLVFRRSRQQPRLRVYCQSQQAGPLRSPPECGGAASEGSMAMNYNAKDEVDGGPPCAPGGTAKNRRPDNTAFKQQRLPAWQPILTAGTVLPTFFIIGLIFIPIGIGIFVTSNNIREIEVRRASGGGNWPRFGERDPPGLLHSVLSYLEVDPRSSPPPHLPSCSVSSFFCWFSEFAIYTIRGGMNVLTQKVGQMNALLMGSLCGPVVFCFVFPPTKVRRGRKKWKKK